MTAPVRDDPLYAAWQAAQGAAPPDDPLRAAWEKAQPRAPLPPLPPLRGGRAATTGIAGDATRRLGGVRDLEDDKAWTNAMRRPTFIEQVGEGLLSMPFEIAKHPVESVKGLAESAVRGFDATTLGRFVAEKTGGTPANLRAAEVGMRAAGTPYTGSLEAAKEPVSAVEAALIALNLGAMAVGGRGGPADRVKPRRPGVTRVPSDLAAERLANVGTVDDLLRQIEEPIATAGDVPLDVPFPPAERAYPMGTFAGSDEFVQGVRRPGPTAPPKTPFSTGKGRRTEAGDIAQPLPDDAPVTTADTRNAAEFAERIKQAADQPGEALPGSVESFPEGFSTTGKVRRPASALPEAEAIDPLRVAWEDAQKVSANVSAEAEPIPTIGEPVSAGRDLAEPGRIPANLPKVKAQPVRPPRGADPDFNIGDLLPDETASVGVVAEKPPRALSQRKTTVEEMLAIGKRRAAELEAGIAPGAAPDLLPAL